MFGSSFLSSLPDDDDEYDDATRQQRRPPTATSFGFASGGGTSTSSSSLPFAGFAPMPPPSSSSSSSSSSFKSTKRSNSSSSSSSSSSSRSNDNPAAASVGGFGHSVISTPVAGIGLFGTTTSFGGVSSPAPASALGRGNASSSSMSSSSSSILVTGGSSSLPSPPTTMTTLVQPTAGVSGDYYFGGGDGASSSSSSHAPPSSVECSCASPDGTSFHSYLRLDGGGTDRERRHAIMSAFAPFAGDDPTTTDPNISSPSSFPSSSALKITTVIPPEISEMIDVDPVIGLICVDDGSTNRRRMRRDDGRPHSGGAMTSILPWMCLYTRKSAFVISVGYDDDGDDADDDVVEPPRRCVDGRVLSVIEPFERHLLASPRGSSILRIRPAPFAASSLSSGSAFHRTGSMAMLLREGGTGGDDDDVYDDDAAKGAGYAIVLYHGLPGSTLGRNDCPPYSGGGGGAARVGGWGGGRDFDGRSNPSTEGSVTTPLRFDDEDLFRGMMDSVDAENEAYEGSSLRRRDGRLTPSMSSSAVVGRVVDFCFMSPSSLTNVAGAFSASSILVLTGDGSVYGASPIIFDGMVLPRDVVIDSTSRLDAEIVASESFLRAASSSSPAPTLEQERVEARLRQCRAARRYLLDVFGLPDLAPLGGSRHAHVGSYYVSASVVHTRSYSSIEYGRRSQALDWQTRLQGPLILPRQSDPPSSDPPSSIPPCVCIESFGGAAGAGIIDGFVVARHCGTYHRQLPTPSSFPIHVEFGILPGEGATLLPRFEFESDADCQLIDDLVRGTGMYVEHATITQDGSSLVVGDMPPPSMGLVARDASVGRGCSIVLDPLDDSMIHVINRSQIVTVTTNAVAAMAKYFTSRVDESDASIRRGGEEQMPSIRTKAWSCLEVNSSDTALSGARVSGDVHMGHVLYAQLSDGSMEVVNITETHFLHEISEQMKAKSEQSRTSQIDDEALEALKSMQPLHEILQPLIDKVCDGLSKMGKIVGGATLPKDAGPENLAMFLETQHSCEVNVLMPMEEISKVLNARRDLLQEMYDHQASELVRLTELLVASKQKYESNLKRVSQLEASASILAQRSSAVLTATRDLRSQITDAEAAYFKDLQRYEASCSKWEGTVGQLRKDAMSSCNAMSAGAIENGDVQCIVDLPPQKVEVCHNLLRGEGQLLKKLENKVKESSDTVEQLAKVISGFSIDAARLKLQ